MINLSATLDRDTAARLPLTCRSPAARLPLASGSTCKVLRISCMISVLWSVEKRVDIENTWRVVTVCKCPHSIFSAIFKTCISDIVTRYAELPIYVDVCTLFCRKNVQTRGEA